MVTRQVGTAHLTQPRRTRPPRRAPPKVKFAKVVTKARGIKKVVFTSKPPIPARILQRRSFRQESNQRRSNLSKEFAGSLAQASRQSGKFGKGSSVTFTTQKGGVQKVRLVSKDKTRSTTFILPANKKVTFSDAERKFKIKSQRETQLRSPEDPRRPIGKARGKTFKKTVTRSSSRRAPPAVIRQPPRRVGSDFDIFRVSQFNRKPERVTTFDNLPVRRQAGGVSTTRQTLSERKSLTESSDRRNDGTSSRVASQARRVRQLAQTKRNREGEALRRSREPQRTGSDFDIFRTFVDNNNRINTKGKLLGKNLRQGLGNFFG